VKLEALAQKVAPSLAPAAQGRRPLFSMADPDRSVALEWSSDATARRVAAYWDQLSISAATETGANITVP